MNFTKMHGLGNDFIIIENMDGAKQNLKELAVKVCDRHAGIGADGILVIEKSKVSDIKMIIINSDGSEAEMCGNGVRCFARYVYDKGIVNKKQINVETLAGTMIAEINDDDSNNVTIKINMGVPYFDKESIPFVGEENNMNYTITVEDRTYKASTILMGVPHTIVYVDKIDDEEIINYGRKIEKLSIFPHGTNVNFVKVLDKDNIELKTWERGAGLTLACGTGTCASVVASHLNELTNSTVAAKLALGTLNITYNNENVFMSGPAEYICQGTIL